MEVHARNILQSVGLQLLVPTIRDHLDKRLSEADQDSTYAHDNQFSGCPFNSFTPISENSLRKIILQCTPKTCELDAIPTSLFFLIAWMQYCLH